MNQEMKLAVLIDAENISSKYIDVILSEPITLATSSTNGYTATGRRHRWLHGAIRSSTMPSSLSSSTAIRSAKIHRTRPSSSTPWIYCTRAISTDSASYRQTVTSPVWHRASANRKSRIRHGRKQDAPLLYLGLQ